MKCFGAIGPPTRDEGRVGPNTEAWLQAWVWRLLAALSFLVLGFLVCKWETTLELGERCELMATMQLEWSLARKAFHLEAMGNHQAEGTWAHAQLSVFLFFNGRIF